MSTVILSKEDIVDAEDVQDEASINQNTNGNVILTLNLKNGLRPFLAFCGQAWDATLDTFVTWRAKADGNTIYRLRDSTVQIAAPDQPQAELNPWLPLPQQCRLTLEMDVGAAGANGTGSGRFRVYYAKVDSGLYLPRY